MPQAYIIDAVRTPVGRRSGGQTVEVAARVVVSDIGPAATAVPEPSVGDFDLAAATPIAHLWNVGDRVKEYANGGTTACAETDHLVAEQIRRDCPLP